MYYPHNEHFLWWAYTFQGRREEAFSKANEIVRLANSPMCGSPLAEKPRFTHLRLLTAVRFGDWDAIATEAEPPIEEALDRVMWHWARATMFAARSEPDAAMEEARAARKIANSDAVAALDNAYLPAINIAGIAAFLAEGRALAARRATADALAAFRAAVALEDAMPYMEPAFWFYPTRHTLGAMLISIGQPAAAADVFREDLRRWPENGWSLHGLALALEILGEDDNAGEVRDRFRDLWQHADIQPSLAMY
jgi:tetratricopeptide (TPR) repeat protein